MNHKKEYLVLWITSITKCFDIEYIKIFNYLIIGLFTTIINFSLYSILVMLNTNYMLSNLIAFCIAIIFAYIANKKWVFNYINEEDKYVKEFTKFFLARVGTLLIESIMLYLGITLLMLNHYGVKIFTNTIVIILNFLLSKFIVFKKKAVEES